jgi:transcriptional regulator with XRE-family HTH domain
VIAGAQTAALFILCFGCKLRREQALSQRDLSRITGIAHDSISQLETGKREAQPRTIRKLAEALGVEPRELMKGD